MSEFSNLPSRPIRLVLADDHPIFREGLMLILNDQPDMTVVGDCGNGNEAVDLVLALNPDLAILDLQMPGMNGAAATAAILAKRPAALVLLLTTYDGAEDIQRGIKAGARGYLLKESRKGEVLQAIREILQGRLYLSPSIGASIVSTSDKQKLTKRECEVLRLISMGKANKEIGFLLGISEGTVKGYVNGLMLKMNVGNRTEAALEAQRRGFLRI